MPWLQAHLEVEKSQAPLVELLFEQLGALSITLEDARDEPMLEPPPGAMPLWRETRVTGLFDGTTDADHLRTRIDEVLNRENSRNLTLEILEDQAWERTWLEHFQPLRFGDNLWICPTGRQVEQPDATIIHLDPGLAFGTGTHPTTALCLEWIDAADLEGKTVMDFGCGSGILAIAALKRGARQAIAIDHDPQALIATRSNAERNQVSERLTTLAADEFQPREADVVLANILANVLVDLSPLICSLVRTGGELVLSGILQHQAQDVARAYEPAIHLQPPAALDGWVRLQGVHA
ncbi:50S ribosomal protein L11 methyltransferase [Thiolapillus brandeum]|uniref:Ribosomal protein L11 methyltransferase n=1 Tax=Thiolapillus brandeum TaxID=1076588 RepID=A0A7U6JFJ7_9GAMM|nr:50S ribosomal protein L11 methyltransferase [Thiolapillus brandeum]BAO43029.1 ribosomal protein L11 methyltransferase [Thiolapillus brandeum]